MLVSVRANAARKKTPTTRVKRCCLTSAAPKDRLPIAKPISLNCRPAWDFQALQRRQGIARARIADLGAVVAMYLGDS